MIFSVSVFTRSYHNDVAGGLCEEQIMLVEAESESEAISSASKMAKDGETSYENESGELICWKFMGVQSAYEIEDDLRSGSELFSRHCSIHEANSLFETIKE